MTPAEQAARAAAEESYRSGCTGEHMTADEYAAFEFAWDEALKFALTRERALEYKYERIIKDLNGALDELVLREQAARREIERLRRIYQEFTNEVAQAAYPTDFAKYDHDEIVNRVKKLAEWVDAAPANEQAAREEAHREWREAFAMYDTTPAKAIRAVEADKEALRGEIEQARRDNKRMWHWLTKFSPMDKWMRERLESERRGPAGDAGVWPTKDTGY